ncbi:uncharacterized protein RCO7_11542 [Rhynchosporium graminicola]|uniref:Uncharacterized protein n=1 Tax=Rhynchosporium graminicola TaxID=2792576 RepID=A0A1E1KVU9_9HELO|nr:uncharacterized protein RCO7_11542 [Rhynchosporium commune]
MPKLLECRSAILAAVNGWPEASHNRALCALANSLSTGTLFMCRFLR